MSYSLYNVPRTLQPAVRELCSYLHTVALEGATEWSIDPEECFAKHGFTWAARINYRSIDVAIDRRRGKVIHVTIELPDAVR